jgi:hypothetical protein
MKNTYSTFLSEFIAEFNSTVNLLIDKDSNIDKEVLLRLTNNLTDKYLGKISQPPILYRILAKFSKSRNREQKDVKPLLEQINETAKSQSPIKSADHSEMIINKSSRILPSNIDIGLIIDPVKEKNQDHAEYFVLKSGAIGIIICDGISGEGSESGYLAKQLPRNISKFLEKNFDDTIDSLSYWQSQVKTSIDFSLKKLMFNSGATTLILAILSSDRRRIYFSWIGDGNAFIFNNKLTGFAKIMFPQRNETKNLTAALTSSGIIGEPMCQIHAYDGGSILISSDGFDLTKGSILQHLYTEVLRSDNLQESLNLWINQVCCAINEYHPPKTDDRSMVVLRWEIDKKGKSGEGK